jgi:hypothetical protein
MTSHLTFEELIDAREPAHCQDCETDAAAWAAVRAAVRHRAAATPPPPGVLESVLAEIDEPGRRRRYLTPLSAAAAVVVLAAGGYGLAVALSHSTATTHTRTAAAFTATGCTGLDLAGGTLTRINGNDLEITTSSGHQITVATTSTTVIYREIVGALGDITDGKRVLVTGSLDGGTLTATSVGVLPATVTEPATPAGPGGLAIGLASGTVTNAHDGGFTVVEADGSRVPVTTSQDVTVISTVRITVAQLNRGEITSAVGTAGTDGTLAASTVEQDAVPTSTWQKLTPARPQVPSGGPSVSTPGNPSLSLNDLGCSPAAITTSYLLAEHL